MKNKSISRHKLTKGQKMSILHGFQKQNTYTTVAEYAKATKIGTSTLYKWAVLYRIDLGIHYTKEKDLNHAHNIRIMAENDMSYADVWALGDAEESKRRAAPECLAPKEQEHSLIEELKKNIWQGFWDLIIRRK